MVSSASDFLKDSFLINSIAVQGFITPCVLAEEQLNVDFDVSINLEYSEFLKLGCTLQELVRKEVIINAESYSITRYERSDANFIRLELVSKANTKIR